MAHLAPSWPGQVLCKENKRKALAEQQRRWMEQRSQELLRQSSACSTSAHKHTTDEDDGDSDSLEGLNGFMADVGRALGDSTVEPPRPAVSELYKQTNAMLREVHLERRSAGAMPATASPQEASHHASFVRAYVAPSVRRSAAQRAAADRLVQPRQRPAELPIERHPAPLIGGEDFYKHLQEGIRHYRRTYDGRIGSHFRALDSGGGKGSAPPAPTDAIGALAHENATRHVAPISERVSGSSSGGSLCRRAHESSRSVSSGSALALPAGSSMLSFTHGKTVGRRAGRSGSIHAAHLQAARDRGPML